MTGEQRQKLREATHAALGTSLSAGSHSKAAAHLWEIQSSNSYRRIGAAGDGDILCAVTQRSDGHPDLHAAPGVLNYIVAAQPRVVLDLLDALDWAEASQASTKSDPSAFCAALDTWAGLMTVATHARESEKAGNVFETAWRDLRLKIEKSCLLDRVLYHGEQPSKTPCPVHKGLWTGLHIGWPGQKWNDGSPVEESSQCRGWYDAGCRCFQHGCKCTTGWQPDEHCGCAAGKTGAK